MNRSKTTREVDLAEVHRARHDLLAVLEPLEIVDWEKATLCRGRRVREVVSHLAAAPDAKRRKVAGRILRGRGHLEEKTEEQARILRRRPPREILDHFRANVDAATLPPAMTADELLTDVVIHSLDICHANGWELEVPADRMRTVLSTVVTADTPFAGRERADGLHFDTTDIDWRCGCGDHVRGPSRATLLALAGRPVCDQLSGDGVAELASRL